MTGFKELVQRYFSPLKSFKDFWLTSLNHILFESIKLATQNWVLNFYAAFSQMQQKFAGNNNNNNNKWNTFYKRKSSSVNLRNSIKIVGQGVVILKIIIYTLVNY